MLVLAGIPRCGTTYVANALGWPHKKGVLKTHGLAPPESLGDPMAARVNEALARGGKAIFMFGDPLHAVMSTLKNQYNREHFRNCGCAFPRDLLEKDWLHYEQMFDSWMSPHPFPVLRVRYETIPRNFGAFKDFLGFMPDFRPWKPRAANPFPDMPRKRLLSIYGNLADKIARAPDVST